MIAAAAIRRHGVLPAALLLLVAGGACGDLVHPEDVAVQVTEVSPAEPPAPGVVPPGGQGWSAVVVGRDHSCALDVGGVAWCWGSNASAQLGAETSEICGPPATACSRVPVRVNTTLRFTSITAGSRHTCGVATDGLAYCWGNNERGQLGTASPRLASEPIPVVGARRWLRLAGGGDHTCGIAEGGSAFCWGENDYGQLAAAGVSPRTSPTPVRVIGGVAPTFVEISASSRRTCAVSAQGVTYCWGLVWQFAQGGLDFGGVSDVARAVPQAPPLSGLSVGVIHACGLEADGRAQCWGGNLFAQQGDGSVSGSANPEPAAAGVALRTIASGNIHTCGVALDRVGYCWGNDSFGQLGAAAPDACNTLPCARVPAAIEAPLRWIAIAAGVGSHTCGVTTLTNIYCWGLGTNGQLGIGTEGAVIRSRPELVRHLTLQAAAGALSSR